MQNIIQVISVVTFIFLGIATFIDLEKLKNFPDMMQGIGMALLAILIPLAIAILSNYYQKKEDQTKDFAILDLHVILDDIFKFKWLLVYFALVFLPTMFWETFSSRGAHFIEIILSVTGVCFVVNTLLDIYRWVKGNPSEFRFKYLQRLDNHEDMESVWCSVWQAKNIGTYYEKVFFKIFSQKIDRLLKDVEKLKTTTKLLEDFSDFINNRSRVVLVSVMLHKNLEWHYKTWKLGKRDIIHNILGGIVNKIEERALKEGGSYPLFNKLKEHSEAHKNEKEYLEYLFALFYMVFFENIESVPVEERYRILESHFPSEWKVTKKHLEDENNFVSRVSLERFIHWAEGRIWEPKGEFDEKLSDVSSNLFPEVEPVKWAPILIFCLTPYNPENRVKSVIERQVPWNFGWKGRPTVVSWVSEEDLKAKKMKLQKDSEENTFELATILHEYISIPKDTFSKKNLERYIEELDKLEEEYKNDSSEKAKEKEGKRAELWSIFKEMIKFLDTRENQVT